MSDFENLISMQELIEQVKALNLISTFLDKNVQAKGNDIEQQLHGLLDQISLFAERFSPLGWCMYDGMSTSLIERANSVYEISGIDEAEKVLVEYYSEDVKKEINRIRYRVNEISVRWELIQCAFEEHFSRRFYASVPMFLIVVDGIVNDFTKSKGLFAEGTTVTAWDCLVGCNASLENVKILYNKGRNKTNQEEIRIPYRNGIMHGRDINYGNEYVSCKCVSLLLAIADWIEKKNSELQRKEDYMKKHEPISVKQMMDRHNQLQEDKKRVNEWQKCCVEIGKDVPEKGNIEEYRDYPYVIPVIQFFEFWKESNYGNLSKILKRMFPYETNERKRAGKVRKFFENKILDTYKIIEIEERGCGLTKIVVSITLECNGRRKTGNAVFGMSYELKDIEEKEVALPWKNNGEWILNPWDVKILYGL